MSRLRCTALAALITLTWTVGAAGADAAAWLPGPSFGSGGVAGVAGLDVAADGDATVAWLERDDGDGDSLSVHVRRVAADGSPGEGGVVGTARSDAGRAVVASTPTGAAVVAWVDGTGALMAAPVAADGRPGAARELAAEAEPASTQIAVDDAGDATVAWIAPSSGGGVAVFVRRLLASGATTPAVALQEVGDDAELRVATSPDGTSWLLWTAVGPTWDDNAVWGARVAAAGTVAAAPSVLSSDGVPASRITLSAGASGAVALWGEEGAGAIAVRGARLPASGAVAGAALAVASDGLSIDAEIASAAIAPDGTVTAVWASGTLGGLAALSTRQFPAGGIATPPRQVPDSVGTTAVELAPQVALAAGGSGFLVSMRAAAIGGGTPAVELLGRRIASDGTVGAAESLGEALLVSVNGQLTQLAVDDGGGAIVGFYPASAQRFETRLFDAQPPVLNVSIPATVEVGADAVFTATASDRSGASAVAWEFGDGSGATGTSVTHVYGRAGSYEVTVRAVDTLGNEAVVRRTLTVTAPVVAPPRDTPPRGTPPKARRAAGLKLGGVARKRAKVTVKGTIAKSAGGRVTVSYAQRIGRRTVVRRTTAKIVKGRWSATLRLTGALARARRGKATVTVVYRGDADTKAARAARTVTVPKAAPGRR